MKLHLPKLLFTAVMAACVSVAHAEFTMPAVEKPATEATPMPDGNISPGPNGFIVAGEDGIDSEEGYFELTADGYYETKYIIVQDYGTVDPSGAYLIVKDGITVGNHGALGVNEGSMSGSGCIQGNVTFAKGGALDVYTAWAWDTGDYSQSGSDTPYGMGRQPFLVKGDMAFYGGSRAYFTANSDRNWLTLPLVYVNGTLSVSNGVKFYFDNDLSENLFVMPDNGLTLFVAKAVKGDFGSISCIASCAVLDEELDEYVDEKEQTLDMHIATRAQSNGLFAVVVTDGSDTEDPGDGPVIDDPIPDGPVIDDPVTDNPVIDKPATDTPSASFERIPLRTSVTMTEKQYKDKTWGVFLRKFGKLDTTALAEDAVLTDRIVMGEDGKLVMGPNQTLKISESQTIGYTIVGPDSMAGHLVFSGAGEWKLTGKEYLADDITCSQGELGIARGTRVGSALGGQALGTAGDGMTDILVKDNGVISNAGEVYAATLETASGGVFTSKGKAEIGKVHVGTGSAVFNSGELTAGEITVNGALNNSGLIKGGAPVVCAGTIYNSGTIEPDIHLAKEGVLDMLQGSKAGTVCVAPRASLVGGGGEVQYAFLEQHACLGSTKEMCAVHVDNVRMASGAAIGVHLGAVTSCITVGNLALEGDVSVVLAADAGILENPGTNVADVSFAIPVLKAESVTGEGEVKARPASVSDPDGVLDGDVSVSWFKDTLMVYGKFNEALLSGFVKDDAKLLADTMWSTAAEMRNFTEAGMRQLSAGSIGAFWVSAFGSSDHMSQSGGISGYESRSNGIAVGGTLAVTESDQLGLGLGYSVGKHDSDDNLLSDEKKSTMLSVFYRHTVAMGGQDTLAVSGYVAYGTTSNEADTHVRGQMGLPGHADWDDEVMSGGVQVAWNHHLSDRLIVSPYAGISFMHVSQDDIKENSIAGNRSFGGGSLQSWTLSGGATLRGVFAYRQESYVSPHLMAGVEAEVARHNPHTTGRVGNTSVSANGHTPGRCALKASAGVDWRIDDNWSAGASYDLGVRSEQVDQAAHIYVKMEF